MAGGHGTREFNSCTRAFAYCTFLVVSLCLVSLVAWADSTPPVLTVPANTAVGCADSMDPSNTGQATATDDTDPSPTITYQDSETYIDGGATTVTREWTATDASGNSSSGDQTIVVTAPPVTIEAASPDIITTLPATVDIRFRVTGCAISGEAFIHAQTQQQPQYWSGVGAVVSDGSTTNTLTVTLLADAIDDDHRMYMYVRNSAGVDFLNEVQDYLTVVASTTPDLEVSETGGGTQVTEGLTPVDIVDLNFTTPPDADVDITITPDSELDVGEGAGSPYTFNYNHGVDSWTRTFQIEVGAYDDSDYEGSHTGTLQITTSSTDADYDGITKSVTVDIIDNDPVPPAGLVVVESFGATELYEQSTPAYDILEVNLNSQPTSTVIVTLDPDDQSYFEGYSTGQAITMTFQSSDWDTAQSVNLAAVDDKVIEGDHPSTIELSSWSLDNEYLNLTETVVADIEDNDGATILIDVPDPKNIALEEGVPQTWYTFLYSQPTATVLWTIDPDEQMDVGAGPGNPVTFTFTAANFDVPQAFDILAVEDYAVEGPHTGEVLLLVQSSCQYYGALADGSWNIDIVDSGAYQPDVVPSGATGGLLDQGLPEGMVPEGEEPPSVGGHTLSAVCEVGDPITGSCEILSPTGSPLVSSWIIVDLYSLTFDGHREILTQLSHEVVTYDWATRSYQISCSTDELTPGYYLLTLVFEGGTRQEFCFEVVTPS